MSSHTAGPLARGAGGAGAGCWASAEPASAALATPAPRNVRRVTALRSEPLPAFMNSAFPGRPTAPDAPSCTARGASWSWRRLKTSALKHAHLDIPIEHAGEEPRERLVLRIPFVTRR